MPVLEPNFLREVDKEWAVETFQSAIDDIRWINFSRKSSRRESKIVSQPFQRKNKQQQQHFQDALIQRYSYGFKHTIWSMDEFTSKKEWNQNENDIFYKTKSR